MDKEDLPGRVLKFVRIKTSGAGKHCLQPRVPKRITCINDWTSLFHLITDVICMLDPSQTRGLMNYIERVRQAAANFPGGKWIDFDEQFRLRQANDPTRSWATFEGDLWITELTAPGSRPAAETFHQGQHSYQSNNYSNQHKVYHNNQNVNPRTAGKGQDVKQEKSACWWFNKANRTCKSE